jgi:hypothetical protein
MLMLLGLGLAALRPAAAQQPSDTTRSRASGLSKIEETDTLPSPDEGPVRLAYTTEPLFQAHTDSFRYYDTTLGRMQQYQRIYRTERFAEDLGNIGSVVYPLTPRWDSAIGFRPGLDYAEAYRLRPDAYRYWDVPRPLSVLAYVQGGQELQKLDLLHSQNFSPLVNAALRYERIVSDGFYFNQNTSVSNVLGTVNGSSHDHRYRFFVHGYFQTVKNRENGGMESDSAFRAEEGGNRQRLPVRLEDAFAVQRYRSFGLDQYYLFGRFPADTLPDTLRRGRQLNETSKRSYLRWNNRVRSWEYRFEEDTRNTDDFPANGFFDNDRTRDLTEAWHWESRASTRWAPELGRTNDLRLTAGGTFHLAAYNNRYLRNRRFRYVTLDGEADLRLGNWTLNGFAEAVSQGDFAGDFRFEAESAWRSPDSLLAVRAYLHNRRQSPDQKSTYYAGNYYFLINDGFEAVSHTELGGQLRIPRFGTAFEVSLHRAVNWIYFDSTRNFVQLASQLNYAGLHWRQSVRLGGFRLRAHLLAQQWIDEPDAPLALPDWGARVSTWYERALFDRALLARLGVDARWHSAFLANGYQPAIGEFAPQERIEVGNYPVVDVWLAGQVQDFRFFAKMEHLNQGLSQGIYYTLPRYPLYPRVFRFGVTWRLLD